MMTVVTSVWSVVFAALLRLASNNFPTSPSEWLNYRQILAPEGRQVARECYVYQVVTLTRNQRISAL